MASTVRNLTVDEAFSIARKLASTYSLRGNIQTGSKIADNDKKKFSFADSAQQEISWVVPIVDKFEISNFKTTTVFGEGYGFKIVRHLNDDVVLMASTGVLSYTLESNSNSGTFEVQEEISEDVWELLGSVVSYSSANEEFVTYAGHIVAGDTDNSIRIVLKGDYPYQVTNYTMYAINFNGDSNVAKYTKEIKFDLPSGFRKLREVINNGHAVNEYTLEDNDYIILNRDDEGIYTVQYERIPKVIDDDSGDDYEFEIVKEAQHLIPYYIAALMIVEDKPEIANVAFQEYEKKINLLSIKKPKKKLTRVTNTLWGVSQYD